MPVFLCVQCCDCSTFQSSQKRKDKKFSCKMCGKKQSVLKVYATSELAKDIRLVVQRMNMARGTAEEEYEEAQVDRVSDEESWNQSADVEREESNIVSGESKWAHIADKVPELVYDEEDDDVADDEEFVTSVPERKRKKGERGRKRSRTNEDSGNIGASDGVSNRKRASYSRRDGDKSMDGESRYRSVYQESNRSHQVESRISDKRSISDEVEHDWGDGFVTRTEDGEAFEEEVM